MEYIKILNLKYVVRFDGEGGRDSDEDIFVSITSLGVEDSLTYSEEIFYNVLILKNFYIIFISSQIFIIHFILYYIILFLYHNEYHYFMYIIACMYILYIYVLFIFFIVLFIVHIYIFVYIL